MNVKELELKLDKVVFIDVPEEKIIERISGRRTCRDCSGVYNVSTIGNAEECPSCKLSEGCDLVSPLQLPLCRE